MKKIKIIAGITWAFLCLILIIILFPSLNNFSVSASRLPFMKINPNYTGGDIAQKYAMENCTLVIRKPVFNGLLREKATGFVQIDWRGKIPDEIYDTINYNFDKDPDFTIRINRKSSKTDLNPLNNKVKDIRVSTPTSYGWAVRINIKK